MGAAGGVEAIVCIKAIEENYVPATINYKVEDPENEESLLAYWKFNEGEGNIVKDHSKHGFDAVSAEPLVWPTGIEIPQINK